MLSKKPSFFFEKPSLLILQRELTLLLWGRRVYALLVRFGVSPILVSFGASIPFLVGSGAFLHSPVKFGRLFLPCEVRGVCSFPFEAGSIYPILDNVNAQSPQ